MRTILLLLVSCCVLLYACQKWEDKPAVNDPRINRPYCNDPQAVNYNWDFPGVPNDSVCFYPVTAFQGEFFFLDSVFLGDNTFAYANGYTLHIYALSHTKIALVGFCPRGDSIKLTTGKSYIATVDSSLNMAGQVFCRMQDTVQGTVIKSPLDSANILRVNLSILTDTGTTFHIGTAIKQ